MLDTPTYQQPSKPTVQNTPESHEWSTFLMKFPDGASVYAWFAPTHWERFAGPIDGRVAVRPCPTLSDVGTLYHDADLPRASTSRSRPWSWPSASSWAATPAAARSTS